MNREFTPSTSARAVCAAAAVVITASIGGFIDYLATDYATAPQATVQAAAPLSGSAPVSPVRHGAAPLSSRFVERRFQRSRTRLLSEVLEVR